MSTTPPSNKPAPTKEELEARAATLERIEQMGAKMNDIYKPQWDARADILKTIISLSSASVVLTVTFSSSLRTAQALAVWRFFVVISFGLFCVALLLSFGALLFGARLHGLRASIYRRRYELADALHGKMSDEDFEKRVDEILQGPIGEIEQSNASAENLFRLAFFCFYWGVGLLAVVGTAQVLA